jgi:hypothetical protein
MYNIVYTDLITNKNVLLKNLTYHNTNNILSIMTNIEKIKFNYYSITTIIIKSDEMDIGKILIMKI